MNWGNSSATESRVVPGTGPALSPVSGVSSPVLPNAGQPGANNSLSADKIIKISKLPPAQGSGPGEAVFSMTLGSETIELVPFKSWGQLDVHKWGVQGKLPGTPAGLEVTPDHIKITGEIVKVDDPEAAQKLEKLFNDWLALEKANLELARKKAQKKAGSEAGSLVKETKPQTLHFQVEVDKRGQVHIHCMRGSETITSVGLTVAGLSGMVSQGLMRKPRVLDIGALHDWVELDGELCSFEHGNNQAAKLEKLLNEQYLPLAAAGQGKDILLFANAASPTGFDIQFPVTVGGVQENRRRTLNDAALELLQEPVRCGLLQPGLILKLSPPTLIIKRKTADSGEDYLEKNAAHTVTLASDDGRERLIDLSQPVNYARLTVVELTAVFNHPVINRHSTGPSAVALPSVESPRTVPEVDKISSETATTTAVAILPGPQAVPPERKPSPAPAPEVSYPPSTQLPQPATNPAETTPKPSVTPSASVPNDWLKPILAQTPIRHDWLTWLLYRKIAEHFGNSSEAELPLGKCWRVLLPGGIGSDSAQDRAMFLTQKGGLGFLGGARFIRFHRGVVFLGTQESVLEGIGVHLLAVALTGADHIIFIAQEAFHSKFGVTEPVVTQELKCLDEAGASLLSIQEVLSSPHPLELIWTVPAEQSNPADPQAIEQARPMPLSTP